MANSPHETVGTVVLCATPLAGHVGPLTTVGAHLLAQGWHVVMITGSRFADQLAAEGIGHVALRGVADFDERNPETFVPDQHRYRGLRLSRYQVEQTFVRPITEQAAALEKVMRTHEVTAVLVDGTFAGALPLLSHPQSQRPPVIGMGVMPLAQSSVDVAPFNSGIPPLGGRLGRLRNRLAHWAVHRIVFRSTQQLAHTLITDAGGTLPGFVLDYSAYCDQFWQLGPAEFEYPRRDLAPNTTFLGPLPAHPTTAPLPPWWEKVVADDRPLIHLTQGTLDNHDFTQLIEPTLIALADKPLNVIVSTGGAPTTTLTAAIPANAHISRYLDYEQLLPHTAIMITNGGYGGTLTALRHGVPLIIAPGAEDKPEVAARAAYFGVGINLETRTPTPAAIADAVETILTNPTITAAARTMATTISTYTPLHTMTTELAHLSTAS